MINAKPIEIRNIRFNFGPLGLCVLSNMTKPNAPIVNNKLEAKPSMIYCPLTRYGMNATGLEWPCSSTVDPIAGGSMITS